MCCLDKTMRSVLKYVGMTYGICVLLLKESISLGCFVTDVNQPLLDYLDPGIHVDYDFRIMEDFSSTIIKQREVSARFRYLTLFKDRCDPPYDFTSEDLKSLPATGTPPLWPCDHEMI